MTSLSPGTSPDKDLPPTGVRASILAAARRQLDRGETLSIKRIAAEAGVSRQTVHAHFGGVRGLQTALAAEGVAISNATAEPTRERLVDAGVRLLALPGAGTVSIDAIAAEAGMTKGAFYHHFADRGELLRAVARRISPVEEMRAVVAPLSDAPTREGLTAIARAYFGVMRPRAELVRNLAANAARDPELTRAVMTEIVGEGAPVILAWFRRQMERGALRPVDPTLVVQALIGPVFLAIVLGPDLFDDLSRVGIHPAVDHVEAFVDILLTGIAPQPLETGTAIEAGARP